MRNIPLLRGESRSFRNLIAKAGVCKNPPLNLVFILTVPLIQPPPRFQRVPSLERRGICRHLPIVHRHCERSVACLTEARRAISLLTHPVFCPELSGQNPPLLFRGELSDSFLFVNHPSRFQRIPSLERRGFFILPARPMSGRSRGDQYILLLFT